MAGVAWGKYSRSDWERVPKGQPGYSATARTFRLKSDHGVIIPRRQYDKHYGSAAAFGTYERKAKKAAGTREQLLRPARGRKSALKLTPEEQEKEIGRRKVAQAEAKQQKLIRKQQSKRVRLPKSITLRNFPHGTQIRRFRTNISHEEIETLRIAGQNSRVILGYWVGLEMVSERDGKVIHIALFGMRDKKLSFTEDDFKHALDVAGQRSYAVLTGMWIAFHLTKPAAIKNGARTK